MKDFKYDIVFSDDEVTGLNGFDIIGELKREKKDCYFIVLTPLNAEKGRLNYNEKDRPE
jgi:DNA-binding response OmpR family regulator